MLCSLTPPLADESSGEPEMEGAALPADRLIEILRQQPELLDNLKTAAAATDAGSRLGGAGVGDH